MVIYNELFASPLLITSSVRPYAGTVTAVFTMHVHEQILEFLLRNAGVQLISISWIQACLAAKELKPVGDYVYNPIASKLQAVGAATARKQSSQACTKVSAVFDRPM
jgi:hypothetical protein